MHGNPKNRSRIGTARSITRRRASWIRKDRIAAAPAYCAAAATPTWPKTCVRRIATRHDRVFLSGRFGMRVLARAALPTGVEQKSWGTLKKEAR